MRHLSKSFFYEYLNFEYVNKLLEVYATRYCGYLFFQLFGNVVPIIVLLFLLIILSYLNVNMYMMGSLLIFICVCLSSTSTFYFILMHFVKGICSVLILLFLQTTLFYYFVQKTTNKRHIYYISYCIDAVFLFISFGAGYFAVN